NGRLNNRLIVTFDRERIFQSRIINLHPGSGPQRNGSSLKPEKQMERSGVLARRSFSTREELSVSSRQQNLNHRVSRLGSDGRPAPIPSLQSWCSGIDGRSSYPGRTTSE